MSKPRIKLEDYHPEMMNYSEQTRRVINAYNGHGEEAGQNRAGWDAVDVELRDILDQEVTAAFLRGKQSSS